jgi:hypothetical protein
LVDLQGAAASAEGHFTGIGRIHFEHRAAAAYRHRMAGLLLGDRRISDDGAAPAAAGTEVEVRRHVASTHIDRRHRLGAAGDGQDAAREAAVYV